MKKCSIVSYLALTVAVASLVVAALSGASKLTDAGGDLVLMGERFRTLENRCQVLEQKNRELREGQQTRAQFLGQ